jgi:hypothetical protein
MNELMDNELFILHELPNNLFLFTLKPVVAFIPDHTELLIESLRTICNSNEKRNTVVLDTNHISNLEFVKSFFSTNFKDFKSMKNTGLCMFIVVTKSSIVVFLTNVFKKLCHSTDIVFTRPSVEQAMHLVQFRL